MASWTDIVTRQVVGSRSIQLWFMLVQRTSAHDMLLTWYSYCSPWRIGISVSSLLEWWLIICISPVWIQECKQVIPHPESYIMAILKVKARTIYDSRGNPTVETDIITDDGLFRSSAPSGASTGSHEAKELRDGDESKWLGKGVTKAVHAIDKVLGPAIIVSPPKIIVATLFRNCCTLSQCWLLAELMAELCIYPSVWLMRQLCELTYHHASHSKSALQGLDPVEQASIDEILCRLDGTEDKSSLGANSIVSISMAVARVSPASICDPARDGPL